MPAHAWSGYHRFCPLARALDIVGERWSLFIIQELMKAELGFAALHRRLPGCSPNLVSARLKHLQQHGLIERDSAQVYRLTPRGAALGPALEELRVWGVEQLIMAVDDPAPTEYDVSYMDGADLLSAEEFELRIDGRPTRMRADGARLEQRPEPAAAPTLVAETTGEFMRQWARGSETWDTGVESGQVRLDGDVDAWIRMQAAMGFLRAYQPGEGD